MSIEQRKEPDWRDYETMEEAAVRLLRVLDERAKKMPLDLQIALKTLLGFGDAPLMRLP
jgi:hypothetical protein